MVLAITKYKCEVCHQEHSDFMKAMKCENLGKEIPLANLYDKFLVKDEWNGGFGETWDELVLYEIDTKGHYVEYIFGELSDGEEDEYYPMEFIMGNEEFKKMCKPIKK